MPPRETSQSIDAAAADWAARVDRGPLSPEDQQTLQAWLDGDSRRLGAFARAQAIFIHSERARALGAGFDAGAYEAAAMVAHAPPRIDRRRLLWAGGGVAASCALLTLGVFANPSRSYASARGEVRLVPLADGSTITLNTDSKVVVTYSSAQRTVRLVHGEAFFEVAPNPARPFVVEARAMRAKAVGAAFTVRGLAERPVQVLVRDGRVELTLSDRASAAPVVVLANMRATVAADPAVALAAAPVTPDAVTRGLAWREGKLAFEGDTLAQAAAEFSRYSETRIVIDDPALGREPITGLFAANDPKGFARAAALSLGARAELRDGDIVLSR